MNRAEVLTELATARGALKHMRETYPELPLLIQQMRARFAEEVFRLINIYIALEARERKALALLREDGDGLPADVSLGGMWFEEDGA